MLRRLAGLFILILMFSACEKEQAVDQDESDVLTIKALAELATSRFLSDEIMMGQDETSFRLENEGLIDEYTASEEAFTRERPQKNSFLVCLISVEPDREQRQQLGRALKAYSNRNERILNSYRQNFRELQQRMEAARQLLHRSYEAGEIDREQYRQKMLMLRERYHESIKRIREANAEAFSGSYTMLLQHLGHILSRDQWNSFASCLAS
jgi:hypothetical protein